MHDGVSCEHLQLEQLNHEADVVQPSALLVHHDHLQTVMLLLFRVKGHTRRSGSSSLPALPIGSNLWVKSFIGPFLVYAPTSVDDCIFSKNGSFSNSSLQRLSSSFRTLTLSSGLFVEGMLSWMRGKGDKEGEEEKRG